jgi:peptide/nickel transport system ATP-binding protein
MSLIEIADLSVTLATARGHHDAVRRLSLSLARGETLGIVGESGSGKSLTALAIMGLLPAIATASGRIDFKGEDLLRADETRLCALRGDRLAMIFQEPMTALNPVHTIGDQIAEALTVHGKAPRREAIARAADLLDRVGIARARSRLGAYPHQLSGGQRQRVMIAIAIACKPDLLIADEPTSALDVSVQAQILDLLRRLIEEEGMALILISHDLGVIRRIAGRVIVMYGGRAVEEGPASNLFRDRAHPYTQGLLAAVPGRHAAKGRRLVAIPGQVPDLADLPPGCPFHGRCARGQDICRASEPPPAIIAEGHVARCFFPGPAP